MAIVSNGAAECNTFLPPLTPVPAAAYTGTEVSVWRCCKTACWPFWRPRGWRPLFWLLTGWLRRREPARVMLLIPARPGCDFAAPAAQMLDLRRQLRGAVPIVLCDCGLEGADLRRARELTERYDDLLLLTAAEIPDHLP